MKKEVNIPLINVESEHCALLVDKGISAVEGVKEHRVELNNRRAIIETDKKNDHVLNDVVKKIRSLGYDVETLKQTFPVTGMTCASCGISVSSILKSQPGVLSAVVNIACNEVTVEYIPLEISLKKMKSAVQSIGYDLVIDFTDDINKKLESTRQKHQSQLKVKTILAIVLCIPLVLLGMHVIHLSYANYVMWLLSTPVLFLGGGQFFVTAIRQARNRSSNMDTLVALSTGIAYLFSVFNTLFPQYWKDKGFEADVYFETAAVVIAFILLGKLLEDRAKSNTSSAIKKLMGLQPDQVIIVNPDGTEKVVPASEINKLDSVLVKPGERIPVDGEVYSGNSSIDESSITGESIPLEKKKGDNVFAGTINQRGTLILIAQKVGGETVLAQIIKMVRQAQGSRAPVQKLVDKIAGIFVPAVIGISILTFIIWMTFGGENALTHAILSTVTVLVIACPCALGLATPTAIMVGIGKGAENGILIKDAEGLEMATKMNAIILDKTGTITEGHPSVTDLIWINEKNKKRNEAILYAIERLSEHPLAAAVVNHLKVNDPIEINTFESITGHGAKASHNNDTYFVGNEKLLVSNGIPVNLTEQSESNRLLSESKTVVFFANGHEVLAIIGIHDKVKATSIEAIKQLKDKGIEVYMLTGDNSKTAAAISHSVGIEHYKAEVLPADKAEFIKSLQNEGKIVGMVGDGINDSHALAEADVSIAMGTGSDIAIDVAKMTIISSDLLLIPQALELSKQTVRVIKQNLFWAFIYNIVGIPIAAGVLYSINGFLLNPMIAGAAMAMSSVCVVGNSLLLKLRKLK
jgi:Cu2+-exporting ATPase